MVVKVYVWDLFVRVFHWSLLALFVTSYVTGEEEHWFHSYSGYAIFSLVMLRIVWGFAGSRYARFTEFVYSPVTILGSLKAIASGSSARFLGHNPAGGAMVLAMLLSLMVITLSGMKLYAIEEDKGPFAYAYGVPSGLLAAAHADDDGHEYRGEQHPGEYHDDVYDEHESEAHQQAEEFWEEIHEIFINVMLLLIVLHVAGVVIASRQHDECLVQAMITGYKKDKSG